MGGKKRCLFGRFGDFVLICKSLRNIFNDNQKMKKLFILMLMVAVSVSVSAQTKKVSVLGDSYSTFKGVGPSHYAPFYQTTEMML